MLTAGTRLGPYEILSPLGAGGMGEVYRARDTRLGRSVALKVVKASGARDPALRERFEREARAISALDHPHICPLYDVGQDAGVEFLVMPCLEGETLASRLHHGALPLDRAVAIATQIADALDRAHRAGFVHRDLKPANIMLTKGSGARHGEVHATLLDFGLAKLTASPVALNPSLAATQPPTQENLTGDATLVGTLLYMAPEQIEGKPVDARADLFALGAILHEMITGRPVFAAASPASVIAAILAHDPPPLSAASTNVSPALDATVQRCLAKSPDDRFQSASDLRFALQTLGHAHPRGADVGRDRSRRNLPLTAALIVVAAIALAGIGWMVTRPLSSVRESVPRLLNSLQVTNAVGVEDYAAWSPDGRTLAYAADPSGGLVESNWDIWVVQPGGTQSLNRTPDSASDDRFPSWSPDGTLLAFWSNRDGGGCYVMPALAGSPRRIAEASRQDPNPPAWSADGSQLACVTLDGNDIYATIHTLRDGGSRRVALPGPFGRRLFMTWSPDQKFMAYIETPAGLTSDATQLWVLRLGDGKAFPITEGRSRTWSPSWSPQSDAIYFVSNLDGAMDLWQQALAADGGPVGPPVRVTTGIGMRSASLSTDGSKVVYSQGRKIANVWRVPIRTIGHATWADARQITFDQAYIEFLSVAPDGKRLIVTSDRSGNPDLWQLSGDGGELQQVVADPSPDWGGTWSPDGRHIAFFSYRSGNRDLWRVPVNGGPAQQLTDHPDPDVSPTWSPDGTTIAFLSGREGGSNIWLLPLTGGQPRRLPISRPTVLGPQWSPDGGWLAVVSVARELWRVSPSGTEPEVRLADQVRAIGWSHDSRSIYFTGQGTRQNTVFAVPTDGGPERALVDLSGRRGTIGEIATDGPNLYFTWEENLGDLWLPTSSRLHPIHGRSVPARVHRAR